MSKIFLSSTWTDLAEHRRRVISALDRLRLQGCPIEWLGMEAFSAANETPAAFCRKYVTQADLYVGILGMRYGSLDAASGLSMTELEYRTALDSSKPCLFFLIDEQNALIHPADMEHDFTGRKRLTELKEEVLRDRVVAFFTTPEDLEGKIVTALQPYVAPPYQEPALVEPVAEYNDWVLDPIPQVHELIGRQQELERYRQILAERNVVVIEGMAGVGKTTLGAQLAREQIARGSRVFWIQFDLTGKNTGELFGWDLAAFLAQHNHPALWQFLQQEASAAKLHNRAARCGLILSRLAEGRYTLCLDDVHLVAQDPDLDAFFNEVRKRAESSPALLPMQLIVMSRAAPPHLRNLFGEPLPGFAKEDAQKYLAAHGIRLPAVPFEELYARVEGNPQFLHMSLPGLQAHQNDSAALNNFIQGLKEQPDVRDYLMEKIYGALPESLQRVLDALSIFSAPVPREVVDEVLAGEQVSGVMRLLLDLINRHEIVEAPKTQTVTLHSLVKDYCYHNLDRAMRLRLHARAATHFVAQRDWIAAASHSYQAKEYGKAAQVLVDHAIELMKSGRRDSMLEQLKAFSSEQLPIGLWAEILRVKGDGLRRSGMYDEAIAAYQDALQITEDEPSQGRLYRAIGNCYSDKGHSKEAIVYLQKQLAISQAHGDTSSMAATCLNLGSAHLRQADHTSAVAYFNQVIELGQVICDDVLVARARASLGLVYQERGAPNRAIEYLQQGLDAFRRANELVYIASALNNLGRIFYRSKEDYTRAAECFQEAIEIYERLQDYGGMGAGYNNLGDVYREQGNHTQAITYFEKSMKIAETVGNEYVQTVVCLGLAESCFALGKTEHALSLSNRALHLAQKIGAKKWEGVAYLELGEIRATSKQIADAEKDFLTSQKLLEQVESRPYLARLYSSYGDLLLANPNTRSQGRTYLERALKLFTELGSVKEVTKISDILRARSEPQPM
jgi:tetratricopeptide (TPR) repeat protein